jgi:hypothetical protein
MTPSFERFAGYCALAAGIGGFLYSVAFVIIARPAPDLGQNLSWLLLLIGGLLTLPVVVALFQRLREIDPGWAMLGLLLAAVGAIGSIMHAGYSLANVIHLGKAVGSELASQVDPRGLLTLGVTGLAILVFAWLIGRSPRFPAGLSRLGLLAGVLLVVVYLARLFIFTPANPVLLISAGLAGFIVSPAFYIWLGLVFLNQGLARRS